MSTHIEHGTRTRAKTVADLNALMLDFRRRVATQARAAYEQKAAALTYKLLDESVRQPNLDAFLDAVRSEYASQPIDRDGPWLQTNLRQIVRQIITDHHAVIARTQTRDPAYDWGCSLSAIPHRTGLYVLLYAESDAYHDIWRAMPGVEEYAYWNHTDPPDGMSPARWERRARRWDELLGGSGLPSNVGLTINVYDPLTDGENRFWQVAPQYIPDFDRRIRHLAFTQAFEEVWHTDSPEERGFQTFFRTQQWIQTSEGAQRFTALQQHLYDVLPHVWDDALVNQPLGAIWEASQPLRTHYSLS